MSKGISTESPSPGVGPHEASLSEMKERELLHEYRCKIGVVTVTYNSGEVLPDFIASISTQAHSNFLLFAVDNASKDGSVEELRAWGDSRLRLIENRENRGVAEGNNQGIRAAIEADCDAVLLLNNDTAFEKQLFCRLLDGMQVHGADLVCPKIMCFNEPTRLWAAGGSFQRWFAYRAIHDGAGKVDTGRFEKPRRVTYAPTCCVLLDRSVFQRVGLMDAEYFVYMDDVDFMYRAFRKHLKLYYLPTAKVLHKEGRCTGGPLSDFTATYSARNRMYFCVKHFGFWKAAPWFLFYQAYYLARFLSLKDSPDRFFLKLRSFWTGLVLGRSMRQADPTP